MSLAPQVMSVPGGDGLILEGAPTYAAVPLAGLAHFSPLLEDLLGFFRGTLGR